MNTSEQGSLSRITAICRLFSLWVKIFSPVRLLLACASWLGSPRISAPLRVMLTSSLLMLKVPFSTFWVPSAAIVVTTTLSAPSAPWKNFMLPKSRGSSPTTQELPA